VNIDCFLNLVPPCLSLLLARRARMQMLGGGELWG
jgi:hypothetical protein